MLTSKEKENLIKKHSLGSPMLKNSARAFFFGGLICAFGELLFWIFSSFIDDSRDSLTLVTVSVIFLASLFTGLGWFSKAAKVTGAGTLVPVSGFSNAITSEAIDSSGEGYVLGVGAKIFTVAGPVIIFGLLSGVIYGLIYYIYTLF